MDRFHVKDEVKQPVPSEKRNIGYLVLIAAALIGIILFFLLRGCGIHVNSDLPVPDKETNKLQQSSTTDGIEPASVSLKDKVKQKVQQNTRRRTTPLRKGVSADTNAQNDSALKNTADDEVIPQNKNIDLGTHVEIITK